MADVAIGLEPVAPSNAPAALTEQAPSRESTPDAQGQAPEPSTDQPEQSPASKGPSRLFQDLDQAERDYKSLQAAHTRATQVLRGLGDINAIRQERMLLQSLRDDPSFLEWAEQKLAQVRTGRDDPETQAALKIVREEARAVAEQLMQERVAPLQAESLQQRFNTISGEMERAYGKEWVNAQPQMFAILEEGKRRGIYAPDIDVRYDLDFVDSLYHLAVGRNPTHQAAQYQKSLEAKKAFSSQGETGSSPRTEAAPRARTMEEAAKQARKALGM